MMEMIRPILELTVIIPGMLLAYLPVKECLKQAPVKLALWLTPLLLTLSLSGGIVCYMLQLPVKLLLVPVLMLLMLIYHKTLQISIWKSSSIFLAVCAVFACVKSLSRAVNAIMIFEPDIAEKQLWLCVKAGIFYNLICLSFVLIAWYPATHMVRILIADENFAQTWYIFWILPLIFIGLNQFMVPKYQSTLYTGRILQIYIVVSIVLLIILTLFYAIFLMMALSLNKNARLQQENHFLSLQRSRYDNLCAAIEETRQVRHDIRHHYLQLAALAEKGDMEKIKEYLSSADRKMPSFDFHFCDNQAVDSILGYYSNHAKQEGIPFLAQIDIPDNFLGDEMDICLVLSNLLENAIEASLKTEDSRRKIVIKMYLHHTHILLIQAENNFDAKILEKNGVFQSTKHSGNGIGIQSIRHITERNGGASNFTYKDGEFTAKIMLRI